MSAKSIQLKLDKAHKKVATKLGYDYNVYRPLNDLNPLDDRNIFTKVKATFTLSDSYTQTISWEVPIWTVYTDPGELEQGDFLYDGRSTYVIISKLQHLPVLAVQCDDRIDVRSVGYADSGTGFAPGQHTYIAKDLPCYISTDGHSIGVNNPGNGIGSVNYRMISVITYLRDQQNLMTRSVSARDGFIGDIMKYDFSSIGSAVKFSARESQTT